MNKSKALGTAWETEIVNTLRANGWPHAERRVMNGSLDRGDIAGLPGVVIEAKNAKTINLSGWLNEAHVEMINAHADVAAVWIKRRGKTTASDGYVVIDGATFMSLLADAGHAS